ncbi:MAG: IS200/IS605 family transposase [Deltaproteobacteria bacterium]|nr:IS200/IS605 family transposase [Deltaproteobacteria bacterium]
MKNCQSLHHTKWDCKYHVVFIPKRWKEKIFGVLQKHLGDTFHELAKQKESGIEVGHLHLDHVHICISIPPKYTAYNVIRYIKGKGTISIERNFIGRRRNFSGENFSARGYFVSTIGLDEEEVKKYIREQEKENKCLDQIRLDFEDQSPSGDS